MIQPRRKREETKENLRRVLGHLNSINGADIVCLPENWCGVEPMEEGEFENLLTRMKEIASGNGYHLVSGAQYMWRGEEIFDSGYVINRNGDVLGYSDKLFPSESVGESEFLAAGDDVGVFQIDNFKIGIVVCIDAAYPEVSRVLAAKGAKIIFNPSNIPKNRIEMWKHIGATRAVENGVYFVFLNNTSTKYPDGREVNGHSFVASPEGEIVAELDESEQVYDLEIDLEEVEDFRNRWKFLEKAVDEKPLRE